jgi:hypothetical protein
LRIINTPKSGEEEAKGISQMQKPEKGGKIAKDGRVAL